ncbi:MAG: quinone-dependent dihydroorotate dehydrogenase [Bacteroidota bacterium]
MSYKHLLKPVLFSQDAEQAHDWTLASLKRTLKIPGARAYLRSSYGFEHPTLERKVWGLTFKNPVGLAAGLDKNAVVGSGWAHLGFGFVELGTVTPRPQVGNPKKRLFRLPKDQAIINRMGFNNNGVEALGNRLKEMPKEDVILGANIGKNKDTPNEEAVNDYLICFDRLKEYVDYFVVNVSSPNTPGLRSLQDRKPLTRILTLLQEKNHKRTHNQPILLKIAPDLGPEQVSEIVEVVKETELSGIVANNTTISRAHLVSSQKEVEACGAGGLSGAPLTQRAQALTESLSAQLPQSIPLVGVGGIMTEIDAYNRLKGGASLIQLYSGLIYEGPGLVKRILKKIVESR